MHVSGFSHFAWFLQTPTLLKALFGNTRIKYYGYTIGISCQNRIKNSIAILRVTGTLLWFLFHTHIFHEKQRRIKLKTASPIFISFIYNCDLVNWSLNFNLADICIHRTDLDLFCLDPVIPIFPWTHVTISIFSTHYSNKNQQIVIISLILHILTANLKVFESEGGIQFSLKIVSGCSRSWKKNHPHSYVLLLYHGLYITFPVCTYSHITVKSFCTEPWITRKPIFSRHHLLLLKHWLRVCWYIEDSTKGTLSISESRSCFKVVKPA